MDTSVTLTSRMVGVGWVLCVASTSSLLWGCMKVIELSSFQKPQRSTYWNPKLPWCKELLFGTFLFKQLVMKQPNLFIIIFLCIPGARDARLKNMSFCGWSNLHGCIYFVDSYVLSTPQKLRAGTWVLVPKKYMKPWVRVIRICFRLVSEGSTPILEPFWSKTEKKSKKKSLWCE